MKSTIFGLFLIILMHQTHAFATAECDKGERRLDSKLKKLFWIGEEASIPRTESDMDKFCIDLSSIIKEATVFKNCLTPFPKIIIGIVGRQVKKLSKQICSSRQKKLDSLSRMKCLNGNNINLFYNCTERTFVQLNYVSNQFINEDVVPGFCCSLTTTTKCNKASLSAIQQSCKSTKQSPIDGLLSGLSGEAGDLICSKYKEPGACEKEFGPQMKRLKEVADANKVPFKKIPIVRPLLILADKLSNKET